VGAVLEPLTLSVAIDPIQAAREVEKAGQHVLGHRPSVAVAARRRDADVAAPQIPTQQVAGARRALMKPFQPRRPGPQIEWERPAAQDDFGLGQQLIALLARAGRTGARS